MDTKAYSLSHLNDAELEGSLSRVVTHIRQRTAELLAHLGEIDARRLYLGHGFGAMFTFCVDRLGFSEDEAAKRIHASRTARQHPKIFALVHEGALTLTSINLIAPHLTADNEAELLVLASGKSKRALEELLAARFPNNDVPASLRKLPETKPAAAPNLTLTLPSTPSAPSPNPGPCERQPTTAEQAVRTTIAGKAGCCIGVSSAAYQARKQEWLHLSRACPAQRPVERMGRNRPPSAAWSGIGCEGKMSLAGGVFAA